LNAQLEDKVLCSYYAQRDGQQRERVCVCALFIGTPSVTLALSNQQQHQGAALEDLLTRRYSLSLRRLFPNTVTVTSIRATRH